MIIYLVCAVVAFLVLNEIAYHLGAFLDTPWSNVHGKRAKQRRQREELAARQRNTQRLERELKVGPYAEKD
jgi:hypothetical protein